MMMVNRFVYPFFPSVVYHSISAMRHASMVFDDYLCTAKL